MEYFEVDVNEQRFVYLLDNIEEDFGVMNLDRDHTLVALFEPINKVQPMKLDGKLEEEDVQMKFGLSSQQSRALTQVLNHHIPNGIGDD